MADPGLDAIDQEILFELQQNARNNTNAQIAESIGVSASTVGKRISRLEDQGVIKGYHPELDYDQAGFPLQVLFICTTPITDREPHIREALELPMVVNIREMMTGQGNVHILVVGKVNDDITRAAQQIDDIGFTVTDEILMRSEYTRPSVVFGDGDSVIDQAGPTD